MDNTPCSSSYIESDEGKIHWMSDRLHRQDVSNKQKQLHNE